MWGDPVTGDWYSLIPKPIFSGTALTELDMVHSSLKPVTLAGRKTVLQGMVGNSLPSHRKTLGSPAPVKRICVIADMSIFGHCPAHDDFYLVVCNHCSQVVKPQAFQKHCGEARGGDGGDRGKCGTWNSEDRGNWESCG